MKHDGYDLKESYSTCIQDVSRVVCCIGYCNQMGNL